MKRLYIVLIILFVVLFFYKRENKEDFTHLFSDDNIRLPALNINKTQNTAYEISKLFDRLSSNQKKTLDQTKIVEDETYTKATIPPPIRQELDQAINALLMGIHKLSGKQFRATYYENVRVITDNEDNRHFIADVFVMCDNGLHKEMNLRLKLDFIKYSKPFYKKRDLRERCSVATTPQFKKYPYVGYPVNNQYVPLPTQVIPTGNEVLATNVYDFAQNSGIDYYIPAQIKDLHLNSIKIMNSTLHLHADLINGVNTAPRLVDDDSENASISNSTGNISSSMGISDNSLDFTHINFDNSLDLSINKVRQMNKWPTVNLEERHVRFPYFKHPDKWDQDGVYDDPRYNIGKGKRYGLSSVMTNNDYETVNKHPYIVELPHNAGENYWLFDGNRGNMGSSMPQ